MCSKVSLRARQELVTGVRIKYTEASWVEKNKILDGFVAATGYQRKYAIILLNKKEKLEQQDKAKHRGVKPKYDAAVHQALLTVWYAANEICAKRLIPFLPELVSVLERFGHLSISATIREKLLSISAATADRLLKTERQKQGWGLSTTKSGSLLKKQIKVRTFNDWNDVIPGFMEGDLVAHCGDTVSGSFLNTLVLTDIVTGWTEFLPLLCKSAAHVISGVNITLELLPFALLGLDTDNGCEFINYDLLNFCVSKKITFTRSRAYKKNDQAHVEEKNGSIVRRLVGYDRYEGKDAWLALADLYSVIRLYVNYFQPSFKLLSKTRVGAKVTKKYDAPQTPCQRLINSENISSEIKERLKKEYLTLDPVILLNQIKQRQEAFWKYAWLKPNNSGLVTGVLAGDTLQPNSAKEDNRAALNMPIINQKYRSVKKPRKSECLRHWRTRDDPFKNVWNELVLKLSINPHLTSKQLLEALFLSHPGQFKNNMLRTLQRRVDEWRKTQFSEAKKQALSFSTQNNPAAHYLSLVLSD